MLALVLFALLCFALVALLAYRERGFERERGEASATLARSRAETAAVRAQVDEERAEWVRERRELNQRIQAPEIAVQEAMLEDRKDRRRPQPIAADDDAAYAERRKRREAERRARGDEAPDA